MYKRTFKFKDLEGKTRQHTMTIYDQQYDKAMVRNNPNGESRFNHCPFDCRGMSIHSRKGYNMECEGCPAGLATRKLHDLKIIDKYSGCVEAQGFLETGNQHTGIGGDNEIIFWSKFKKVVVPLVH